MPVLAVATRLTGVGHNWKQSHLTRKGSVSSTSAFCRWAVASSGDHSLPAQATHEVFFSDSVSASLQLPDCGVKGSRGLTLCSGRESVLVCALLNWWKGLWGTHTQLRTHTQTEHSRQELTRGTTIICFNFISLLPSLECPLCLCLLSQALVLLMTNYWNIYFLYL